MKFKMKKFGVAFVAAILATAAMASTETGVLTVNATVTGACAMAFAVSPAVNTGGTGTPTSSDVPGLANVAVICTSGQSGTLSADPGAHYNAGRRLSDLATTPTYVVYELYKDNAYSTVLDTTNTISVAGTGTSAQVPIYGRIAAAAAAILP
jgi:spore coat protein U-like protein